MDKISIIIPIVRPERAERCIRAIRDNAGIDSELYEIVTLVDEHEIGCPRMVKKLVDLTRYDLVCFLGDDAIPQRNFLKAALGAMRTLPDGWGLVGLNDQLSQFSSKIRLATHWLASKKLLPLLGGEFFHTGYLHCFVDNELTERCNAVGRYTWCAEAVITHDNPYVTGRPWDEHYRRVYALRRVLRDRLKFHWRKARKWK